LANAGVRTGKLRYLLPFKHLKQLQDAPGEVYDDLVPAEARGTLAFPVEPLTDREINMLQLVAEGLSNKEISLRSRISICTTKWHLRNAFVKLDVSTRTGAIARARALQLIA
jgi:LuxR family transcriptional regulator, maltose regulon positive regulatory protein